MTKKLPLGEMFPSAVSGRVFGLDLCSSVVIGCRVVDILSLSGRVGERLVRPLAC